MSKLTTNCTPADSLTASPKKDAKSDPIVTRLNRAQGQLTGVVGMYEEGRNCVEIVQQILAVRNALGSAARVMLSTEATRCSRERKVEELDAVIKELLRA
ncbi:MAG: metal-sensitive transcriptional regulator [Patescibacteria group bacterium]